MIWAAANALDAKGSLERMYPLAVARIEGLRALRPNWDSYGAENPSPETINTAYTVLGELSVLAERHGTPLPQPEVGPGAKGTIQFEWDIDGKGFELEISVADGGPIFACLICPDEDPTTWEEEQFRSDVEKQSCVQTFLSWL